MSLPVAALRFMLAIRLRAEDGRSMLVPHLAFKLGVDGIPFSIDGVVVGPCVDPALAAVAVDSALYRFEGWLAPPKPGPPVRHSQVPYRNW